MTGDANSGKSSLVTRFADDDFYEDQTPTIGVDFRSKSIDIMDKSCRLRIWDLAGQERFKSLNFLHYQNAHAMIICFDITKRESFKHINDWIRDVERCAPSKVLIMLVGTKLDMFEQRAVTEEEAQV